MVAIDVATLTSGRASGLRAATPTTYSLYHWQSTIGWCGGYAQWKYGRDGKSLVTGGPKPWATRGPSPCSSPCPFLAPHGLCSPVPLDCPVSTWPGAGWLWLETSNLGITALAALTHWQALAPRPAGMSQDCLSWRILEWCLIWSCPAFVGPLFSASQLLR